MKRLISFAIMFFVILTNTAFAIAIPENDVRIFLNNDELIIPESFGKPFIDDQSRTQIPLRAVAEGLGHEVAWDGNTWTVSIDKQITIKIGERVVNTPNGQIKMDTEAVVINGRTYVPLRFVVEALGYTIAYDWKGYHRIDIYNTSPVEQIGQETTDEEKIYFTDNKELVEFFETNFSPEQYEIAEAHVYFDRKDAHLRSDIVFYNFVKSKYYLIEVRSFSDEGNRRVLKQMLSSVLDEDTANHIYSEFVYAWDNEGKGVVSNQWLKYKNIEYYYNTDVAGVEIKIKY